MESIQEVIMEKEGMGLDGLDGLMLLLFSFSFLRLFRRVEGSKGQSLRLGRWLPVEVPPDGPFSRPVQVIVLIVE